MVTGVAADILATAGSLCVVCFRLSGRTDSRAVTAFVRNSIHLSKSLGFGNTSGNDTEIPLSCILTYLADGLDALVNR